VMPEALCSSGTPTVPSWVVHPAAPLVVADPEDCLLLVAIAMCLANAERRYGGKLVIYGCKHSSRACWHDVSTYSHVKCKRWYICMLP
jgi:hypothetical protein